MEDAHTRDGDGDAQVEEVRRSPGPGGQGKDEKIVQ